MTVLLRAPPNANVQIVQIGVYGAWGSGITAFFWLVPPDGGLNLATATPNTYPLFISVADLQSTTIAAPAGVYASTKTINGVALWIPAGWALAVAPSGTTSGSAANFSAVGIVHASRTWSSKRR